MWRLAFEGVGIHPDWWGVLQRDLGGGWRHDRVSDIKGRTLSGETRWGARNFDPASRQFRGASSLFPLNHDLKPYGPHCDSCLRGIVGAALAARWGKAGDRG
jgi:hypothetical protein